MTSRTRKTPRAYELMPIILDILKRDKRLKRPVIDAAVRPFLKQRGYSERPPATGYALTYLKKEGYVDNQQERGVWTITRNGTTANLAEEWGKFITVKYEKPPRRS